MPSVLITGASGFIGSFLTTEGLTRGYEVFVAIRQSSSREYLQDPRIRFLEFNTSGPDAVRQSVAAWKASGLRFDYVIHNAGVTKARKKGDFERINRDLTIHFINALKEETLVPGKLLYMSSLAAWGPGDSRTMQPVRLTDPPRPAGSYGKSKLAAERFLVEESGIPYVILRPTGVYGPREQDYFTLYQSIRKGIEPYLGSSGQMLTFIYVKDLVRAAFDLLASGLSEKAYFISDGNVYTAGEFAAMVKSILGRKTIRIVFPLWLVKVLSGLLEDLFAIGGGTPVLNRDKYDILSSMNWTCDPEPLFNDLAFTPEYDLQKGLEETIGYCRQHGLL